MSSSFEAVSRLTAWLREYGKDKTQVWRDDLAEVLRMAAMVLPTAETGRAPTIPVRFLAGSAEPATAYTVAELRELLAELPGTLGVWSESGGGVMLAVHVGTAARLLKIGKVGLDADELLADPDGDFELDDLDTRHDTDAEGK